MPDTHFPVGGVQTAQVPLTMLRHPFRMDRDEREMPAGLTIAEMMVLSGLDPAWVGLHAHVWIDDAWYIPREHWHRVRPRPGRRLSIRVVPAGGGGGGKNPLRTILMLAVVAASFIAGPEIGAILGAGGGLFGLGVATWTGIAQAGIGIVGGLIVQAIAPPALPNNPALQPNATDDGSPPVYSLVGATNRANPWGPVPVVLGRHRIWPPYAARYYTMLAGDDQYLHLLFCLGPGPLVLSDHKIGETPVSSYEGVQIEVRQGYPGEPPPTLFPGPVREDAVVADLTAAGGWVQRTTAADVISISVDVECPRGLYEVWSTNGSRNVRRVDIEVQFAPAGTGAWGALGAPGTLVLADVKTTTVRRTLSWGVPQGQYDVRLRRLTADHGELVTHGDGSTSTIIDDTRWTVVRSVQPGRAVLADGMCLVALRIKASGQINGTVQEYNCVASRIAPAWNGAAWVAAETANPAAMYRWALQGGAIAPPAIADAAIDLTELQAWAADCTAAGRQCNGVIDSARRLGDVLHDIAATGRARRGGGGGKYSVVRDRPQTVPVQLFGPRNSWGFKARKEFRERVHGLHCRFVSARAGYQSEQIEVYADGYSAGNATRYETMEFAMVTDPDQVWRDARYHLAQYTLRPESYELSADIEHLRATRGDLIELTHDAILVGHGQARVKTVTTGGGGTITGVTIDEVMTQAAGPRYGVRGRDAAGTLWAAELAPNPGDSTYLIFAAPLAAGTCAAGDLLAYGELGLETLQAVVKDIEAGPDLSARLTLVPAAPGVHLADQGAIPAWDPRISRAPQPRYLAPAQPIVTGVRSDEAVLVQAADGSLASRIVVALERRSGGEPATTIEAQYRRATGTDWTALPALPGDATEVSVAGVEDGVAYDVRLRALSRAWVPSPWTTVTGHVVVGQTTPPPDVPQVWLHGSQLWWSYPQPPADLAGFRILHLPGNSRARAVALPVHAGLVGAPPYDVSVFSGTRTLFVLAVDRGGRESTNAAILIRGFGDPDLANVVVSMPYAPDFAGDVTGGAVAGGEVRADGDGGLYLADGAAPYLPAGGDDYLPVQYRAMTYRAGVTLPHGVLPARLTLQSTIAGDAWSIWWRRAGADLYLPGGDDPYLAGGDDPYLGGWDDFAPWPGSVDLVAREPIDIEVRVGAGRTQGRISALTAVLDVPDLAEELEDVVLPPGGGRLPVTLSYRAITSVRATLYQDGYGATSVVVVDRDPAGPLLAAYAGATPATATVGATIKGY